MKEFGGNFFWLGDCGVLLRVLGKMRGRTWCFGGEFVVECVANVVLKQPRFQAGEMGHRLRIYFWRFPLRERLDIGSEDCYLIPQPAKAIVPDREPNLTRCL
jgi:hypothetical protein